jgi:hypothetical protein
VLGFRFFAVYNWASLVKLFHYREQIGNGAGELPFKCTL